VHRPLISEQHWHAGEPLHVVLRSQLAPDQLHPALSSVRVASLKLRNSFSELTPAATSAVIAALASSASTLTALHRLPLWDEEDDEDEVDDDVLPVRSREPALAAFTQLRALTLRETTTTLFVLRANSLPTSFLQLKLVAGRDCQDGLPLFAAFDRLQNLRRLTLRHYESWHLGTWDDEEERSRPPQLPPNLQVGKTRLVTAL